MSLNVDQSIEHAAALPLELQDSLGIWVGDVAWCNRMGSEEWREACVLDVARGSDLVLFWGDLTLLDATDREFLARIHRWVGRLGRPGDSTVRIGGSAWNAEPYGYARPADGGVVMTVVNPGWHAATMPFDRLLAHAPPSPRGLLELYPHPGVVEPTEMIELAPFEVRVLAVVPAGRIPLGTASQQRVAVRPTRTIEVGTFGALSSVSEGTWQTVSGELRMPDVELGDILYVTHRLIRDGEWTYHPEPQAHVRFDAGLDGLAVHQETMPRQRDRNGPGSSWIIRRIRVGPKWSGRDLRIVISTDLPLGTEVKTEARVVDAWWRREERSFRDLLGDGGPRGSETHAPTLNAPL